MKLNIPKTLVVLTIGINAAAAFNQFFVVLILSTLMLYVVLTVLNLMRNEIEKLKSEGLKEFIDSVGKGLGERLK